MAINMKTILLGMNNPVSVKPEHALYPYPPGCTGWRIHALLRLKMPDMTMKNYLDGFERRNMLVGDWSMRRAKERVPELLQEFQGRTVVVFGAAPRAALGLPERLVLPLERDGVIWRQLPHPSGRNRWYNDPRSRELAASLLTELYLRGATQDARHQS